MAEPLTVSVLLLVACTGLVLLPVSYLAAHAFDYRPRQVLYRVHTAPDGTAACPYCAAVVVGGTAHWCTAANEELLLVPASALDGEATEPAV